MISRVKNIDKLVILIIALFTAILLFAIATPSFAQNNEQTPAESVLEGNYNVTGHLTEVIEAFDKTSANITTRTGDYYARVIVLMLGFSAIRIVILLLQYVFAKLSFFDLLAHFVQILFVVALLLTYSLTVDAFSDYSIGISSVILKEVFGTESFAAPIQYLIKQSNSFHLVTNGGFAGIIVGALWKILTIAATSLFLLMTLLVLYLPISLIFMLKIVGLLFIPTLVIPQFSFLFVGWVRTFLSAIVFIVLARISVIVVVVLFSTFFNEPLPLAADAILISAAPVADKFVPVLATASIGMLLATFALGSYLLFLSGQVAAKITGGLDGGLSAAAGAAFSVTSLSKNIGRIAAKGGK